MDAIELIKQQARMCDYYFGMCSKCPIYQEEFDTCIIYCKRNPEEVVKIIEKWSQEHPQKTMMQDFFGKHPNAPKRRDGTPVGICPSYCGYTDEPNITSVCEKFDRKCLRCWSRLMEE